MTQAAHSQAEFFETKYQTNNDPWNFEKSHYERRRYGAILTAIKDRRYHRAFEPGCSIGVLTEELASFCDQVIAIDFSPTASSSAARRCSHLSNVKVLCLSLNESLPLQTFDLIILSEIGYYFTEQRWRELGILHGLVDFKRCDFTCCPLVGIIL